VIGSIGAGVGPEHNGRYDIVLSNPPWTSVPKSLGREMEKACRAVLMRAGVPGAAAFKNPDHNPDIPFLIRSTEWCKEGGRIAMALPARLLLRNKPIPAAARNAVFRLIDCTGIISGVYLAKTGVWPGTDQPFILLFARNERPGEDPRTQLVCPHYDSELNDRGEFRIDADASRVVNPLEAEAEPWLWKGWLVGSLLDVEVVRNLLAHQGSLRVSDYWDSTHGHPQAELLARYLHLLVHSSVLLHFGLITGAQFGAERNKLQKQSIEDFPIVPLEALTNEQKTTVEKLSARLVSRDADVFDAIDRLFAKIHRLTDDDLDVIRDTLDVGQAYRESAGQRACAAPTLAECGRFVEPLRALLAPIVETEPENLLATLWFPDGAPKPGQTFGAILLGRPPEQVDEQIYRQVVPMAATSSTRTRGTTPRTLR
jgi:hypothetical protein